MSHQEKVQRIVFTVAAATVGYLVTMSLLAIFFIVSFIIKS